jgi:hypothetical protein
VVAQETGFSDWLPTGHGLFAFTDIDEAAEAVAIIQRDYQRHRRSARALAETYFDSNHVLARLLDEIGVAN